MADCWVGGGGNAVASGISIHVHMRYLASGILLHCCPSGGAVRDVSISSTWKYQGFPYEDTTLPALEPAAAPWNEIFRQITSTEISNNGTTRGRTAGTQRKQDNCN